MRHLCLLILLVLSLDANAQGWKRLPDPPRGALDVADDQHLMMFFKDTLLLSDDGGISWYGRRVPKGNDYFLHSAKRISDSSVLLCGYHDDKYYTMWTAHRWKSIDTGSRWEFDGYGYPGSYTSAMVVDRTTNGWSHGYGSPYTGGGSIEIVGSSNALRYRTNETEPGGAPKLIMSLDTRGSEAYLLLGQYSFKTLRSTDDGATWSSLDSFNSEPGNVRAGVDDSWFVSTGNLLVRYRNGGAQLDTVLRAPANIRDFQFRGSYGFLGLEDADYLLASTDSGNSWFAQSMDNSQTAYQIFIPSDSVAYAQTTSGVLKLETRTLSAGPVLHVKRTIDLGKISPDSIVQLEIEYINVGHEELSLAPPTPTSPNFLDIHLSSMRLSPSTSATLSIKYKLQGGKADTSIFSLPTNTSTGNEVIEIRAQLQQPASIEQAQQSLSALTVSPNPATSEISLTGPAVIVYPLSAEVTDVTGRVVLTDPACWGKINISSLPPGTYYISAAVDARVIGRSRFVK